MLSSFVLFTALVAYTTADGYNCAGNTLVNPPADLSEPYYYPAGWREGMEPAKYAGSQMCNWQINVLKGMYATVTFYKNTDMESGITTTYPNGQQQYIEDKDENPYIFTNPQFQVDLRVSDKQGEFSFKVVWSKYPGACQMNMELTTAGALSATPNECVTTFSAPNKVMLVGFTLKDDMDVLLRQTAVYDGDSVNGKYLGNLYYARYQQIVSESKKLTVYTWGLHYNINYTMYMGMDTMAAGDVEQFTGLNCPSNPTKPCYITLNSIYNVSAIATIGRQPDYLKQFLTFPAGATLKIYEEQINDDHLLTTIDRSNYQSQFPMSVKTSLKIYHLNTGRVSIPLTNNANDAQYNTVFDGRSMKIHSFDYRRTSYDQDTLETYQTQQNEKLYFKFNVKYFDINGPTSLAITVSRDGNVVYSDSFTSSNMPPANTIKVYGDSMTVNYQTYKNYTRGFEVDLLTTKNDDSSSPSPPSPSVSTVVTSTQPVSSSTSSKTSSEQVTMSTKAIPAPLTSSIKTDSPTTGQTNAPGVTTVTQGYETTTKSGDNQFSLVSILILIISFIL